MAERRRALITGIAGSLAQLLARELADEGFEIIGVDYRPVVGTLNFDARIFRAAYNKTKIEDIFRKHPPSHVVHLGRVGNLRERAGKRFDLNVVGSRKVMDLSCRYGAEKLVVLSTFHIYGAHPANHIPIAEDEPLRAGSEFPQIADAIQLDSQALTWIYQHPEIRTVLLRPCNVIGHDINNAISKFLRLRNIPWFLGFDPMLQFVHQDDMVAALLATTKRPAAGVFNVAGQGSIPYSEVTRLTEARPVPVPSSLAKGYLRVANAFGRSVPPYLINFFKYPCIVDDRALRETFDWVPKVDQAAAIRSTARSMPLDSA